MQRKTVTALIVFLMLLAGVYWLMRRPEKGQRTAERLRPLAPIAKTSVEKISLTTKQASVVLVRTKDGWKLTKPVDYPADSYATNAVVEKLDKLEFGDLVSQQQSKHAEYDVDDARGVHVVVEGGGKVLADFYLGKVIDDFTMLRPAGKDEVYQVVGSLRFIFDRELKSWRKRTIAEFKQDDVRKLEVESAGAKIVLSRPDEKKPWKVESSTTPVEKLDESTVSGLLSTFYALQAFDFADGLSLEAAGLDKPRSRLTVSLKSGSPVTLLIGSANGDDYRVQRQGLSQIFLLKRHSAENLLKRPADFRDKTILSFKAADVQSFSIDNQKDKESVKLTVKGSEWLANGKPVKDPVRIKTALEALATLKGDGFAIHSAEELGLKKPNWIVEIQMKNKSKLQLTVGSVEKESAYGLIRSGSPEIYILRKWSLDRFLLEPKSFK